MHYHIVPIDCLTPAGSRIGEYIPRDQYIREIDSIIQTIESAGRHKDLLPRLHQTALYLQPNEMRELKSIFNFSERQWSILRDAALASETSRGKRDLLVVLKNHDLLELDCMPHRRLGAIRKDGEAVRARVEALVEKSFSHPEEVDALKRVIAKVVAEYEKNRKPRINKEPGYIHPLEVLEIALKLGIFNIGISETVICAALLGHDLLEDFHIEGSNNIQKGHARWPGFAQNKTELFYTNCGLGSEAYAIYVFLSVLTKPQQSGKARRITDEDSQHQAHEQLREAPYGISVLIQLLLKSFDSMHNRQTQDAFLLIGKPEKIPRHVAEATAVLAIFDEELGKYFNDFAVRKRSKNIEKYEERLIATCFRVMDAVQQEIARAKNLDR